MKKADQWREKRDGSKRLKSFELVLPSGMAIRTIPFNMTGYIMSKKLPQQLTAAYLKASSNSNRIDVHATVNSIEDLNEITDFMRLVVTTCVVEPQVVLSSADPDKDEINIDEIPWEDIEFIFRYLTKQLAGSSVEMNGTEVTVASVESFRDSAEGPLPADGGRDGATVPRTPEQDSQHQ